MGRPSGYKKEYDEQAYKFCLLGAVDKQLAEFFGVTEQTLNNWKKNHSSFFASIKEGKEQADATITHSLFHRAKGYTHRETVILSHQGEMTEAYEIDKHYAPDTTACIFWLCNRRPDLWRRNSDKPGGAHDTTKEELLSALADRLPD